MHWALRSAPVVSAGVHWALKCRENLVHWAVTVYCRVCVDAT